MTLKYLLKKEFLQMRRNAFLPRLIVIFPVMIMCVMPWVMTMEVKNVAVEIVDNDRSAASRRLVGHIEASNHFVFRGMKETYADALADIESSEADIVVEIPHNMERDLAVGRLPKLRIAANAVNGTKGNIALSYMSTIVTAHVAPSAAAVVDKVSVIYLYNKHLDSKLFMIPSLLAILVMLMCGFLPALNIVGEKEKGTIEAMNVTPVGRGCFILSKLVPYWIVAFVVMTVCLLLAWLVYGITSAGSLWLVYFLAMLLALVFSGLGLVISNCNATMQQAVFVMWFFVVCLILLSGLFTPVRSMPSWAYLTTYFNPMHYFIDAIRTVFVRGGGFLSIAHQAVALSVCAVIMNVLAVVTYRKRS